MAMSSVAIAVTFVLINYKCHSTVHNKVLYLYPACQKCVTPYFFLDYISSHKSSMDRFNSCEAFKALLTGGSISPSRYLIRV